MMGLEHPVTEFFDDHPHTILGGDEIIEMDGPFLTPSDLKLIKKGWDYYNQNTELVQQLISDFYA